MKNDNSLGLINGMFLTLEDIVDEGSLYFSAVVHDEDGRRVSPFDSDGRPGRLRIYKGHFEDHIAYDAKRKRLFVTGKNWPSLFEITLTGPR